MSRPSSGRHGPTLQTWRNMRDRCTNLKNANYDNYGGRGISICARWDSFENFVADMGEKPDGLSIDRINNDGNYEPSNCRWATSTQQARNTRRNVVFDHNGERLCIAEIAERTGVDQAMLTNRLVLGWSLERAISTPLNEHSVPEPYSRLQVKMRDFQHKRRAMEAAGLTSDQIANRAPRPEPKRSVA